MISSGNTHFKALGITAFTLLFCLIGVVLHAQTDTAYLNSYYNKFVPRVIYNYNTQDFYFSNKSHGTTTTTAFHTGNEFSLGADLSYKWIDLSYSFSLSPDQSRHNMDFRFSTAYNPFQFQVNYEVLQNLNYAVTKAKKGAKIDTVLSDRENNVDILAATLKVDYVFNYHQYSYGAGFSQGGKILKNSGSFIASVAVSNNNFFLDNLSIPARASFDSTNGFTSILIKSLDMGLGYGYNWALGKRWSLSAVELPNLEFQIINAQSPKVHYATLGFVNHFKGGAMYTFQRGTLGFSAYNMASTSKIKVNNYSNVYTSVNLYFGWTIEVRKRRIQ